MRDRITQASVAVLIQRGLNGWTVDEVARKAGCAKGLVNYHHRSKQALLVRVAESLRDRRWAERTDSARSGNPLDRLWQTLMQEVDSGRFAAWLGLLSADAPLRGASTARLSQPSELAEALGAALGLGTDLVPKASLIAAALDGLELRLLEGAVRDHAEEAYHRFWMTLLEM